MTPTPYGLLPVSMTLQLISLPIILAAMPASADTLPDGVSQNLVLAPSDTNPRNSEGDFINLKDGRILFIYTHFTDGAHDNSAACLASRVSSDGGKTWSDQDLVVIDPTSHHVVNIMSVSLLRLADGRIALFYLVKKSDVDCRMVMRISTDEAKTWGEPTLCMADEGYFVVNNGRAVQLKNGRIVLPAAQHDLPRSAHGLHPGIACCFCSDDAGITWHRSKTALEPPPGTRAGFQEPAVVELKDGPVDKLKAGRLMMLIRTDMGSQFRSYSSDGGETWSPAEKTDIFSPLSPCSIKRIASTGDLLLVWNDHSHVDDAYRGRRTPLTVAVSKDEGKTWEHRKTLYDDPSSLYCYTAIDFVGDRVLLAHCAGQQIKPPGKKATSGLARTVITSFEVGWLYQ